MIHTVKQPTLHMKYAVCTEIMPVHRYARPLQKGPRRNPELEGTLSRTPISPTNSPRPRRPEWQDSRLVRSLSPPLTRTGRSTDPSDPAYMRMSMQHAGHSRHDALERLRILRTRVPTVQKENEQRAENKAAPAHAKMGPPEAAQRFQRAASRGFALLAAAFCSWHRLSQQRW